MRRNMEREERKTVGKEEEKRRCIFENP